MVQAVLDYIFCKSNNSLIWKQSTVCKYSFLIHPTYTPSFPHVPSLRLLSNEAGKFPDFSFPTLFNPMDCSPPGSSVLESSRQEHWSGLPFPSPGDLPHPGIKPRSSALQADSLPSEPPGKSYPTKIKQQV